MDTLSGSRLDDPPGGEGLVCPSTAPPIGDGSVETLESAFGWGSGCFLNTILSLSGAAYRSYARNAPPRIRRVSRRDFSVCMASKHEGDRIEIPHRAGAIGTVL